MNIGINLYEEFAVDNIIAEVTIETYTKIFKGYSHRLGENMWQKVTWSKQGDQYEVEAGESIKMRDPSRQECAIIGDFCVAKSVITTCCVISFQDGTGFH
jgi:hypothetical protein